MSTNADVIHPIDAEGYPIIPQVPKEVIEMIKKIPVMFDLDLNKKQPEYIGRRWPYGQRVRIV